MNVVLTGGGTAGHINPALALAEELKDRGCTIVFVGTPEGLESRLVPEAGIDFVSLEASGFNRRRPHTLIKGIYTIGKSSRKAKLWLKKIKADVVVGFGGYVSIPVAQAAQSLNIPVVVHEQNSYMGLANRVLSKKAVATALTYQQASQGYTGRNYVVTGNPVRHSVIHASRQQGRNMLGVPEDSCLLVVFGGSLGARHINQAVCRLKDKILAHKKWYVVHITGKAEYNSVLRDLALDSAEEKRWKVLSYQNNMGETLAAADAVLSRAGATSLAEISALCIPALLVPFPYATHDHQTSNAQAYVKAGCALLESDKMLDDVQFEKKLMKLIEDKNMRDDMAQSAQKMETANAAAKLADVVMGAVQNEQGKGGNK